MSGAAPISETAWGILAESWARSVARRAAPNADVSGLSPCDLIDSRGGVGVLSDSHEGFVRALYERGLSYCSIAQQVGVSRTTVRRFAIRHGIAARVPGRRVGDRGLKPPAPISNVSFARELIESRGGPKHIWRVAGYSAPHLSTICTGRQRLTPKMQAALEKLPEYDSKPDTSRRLSEANAKRWPNQAQRSQYRERKRQVHHLTPDICRTIFALQRRPVPLSATKMAAHLGVTRNVATRWMREAEAVRARAIAARTQAVSQ